MCSSQSPDRFSTLSSSSGTWTLAQSLQAIQYKPFLPRGLGQEADWVPHPNPSHVPRSQPFGGTQVPSSMTQLWSPIIRAPLWGGAVPFA